MACAKSRVNGRHAAVAPAHLEEASAGAYSVKYISEDRTGELRMENRSTPPSPNSGTADHDSRRSTSTSSKTSSTITANPFPGKSSLAAIMNPSDAWMYGTSGPPSTSQEDTGGRLVPSYESGVLPPGYTGQDYDAQAVLQMQQGSSVDAGQYAQYTQPSPSSSEQRGKRHKTTPEEANHECPICGKLFGRTYNFKAHMETHDPSRNIPNECQVEDCGKRFVRKTDLKRHQESVHEKQRNYQCTLCGNLFARKDTLQRHMEDGCSKRFEISSNVIGDVGGTYAGPSSSEYFYSGSGLQSSGTATSGAHQGGYYNANALPPSSQAYQYGTDPRYPGRSYPG